MWSLRWIDEDKHWLVVSPDGRIVRRFTEKHIVEDVLDWIEFQNAMNPC